MLTTLCVYVTPLQLPKNVTDTYEERVPRNLKFHPVPTLEPALRSTTLINPVAPLIVVHDPEPIATTRVLVILDAVQLRLINSKVPFLIRIVADVELSFAIVAESTGFALEPNTAFGISFLILHVPVGILNLAGVEGCVDTVQGRAGRRS